MKPAAPDTPISPVPLPKNAEPNDTRLYGFRKLEKSLSPDAAEDDEDDDARFCSALGTADIALLFDTADWTCPAEVPAAWATEAFWAPIPASLVVRCGGVNGVTREAACAAPA